MSLQKAGKYACFEFERKFLLPELPPELLQSKDYVEIEDKYFLKTNLRLRIITAQGVPTKSKLTQKFVPVDSNLTKTIITSLYLDDAEVKLIGSLAGSIIKKRRYKLHMDGNLYSVDVFESPKDLIIAEIEFDSEKEMNSFVVPMNNWAEISLDDRYSGGELAKQNK